MDLMERMDPELAVALQDFPAESVLDFDDIEATRRMSDEMLMRDTAFKSRIRRR